MRLYVVFSVLHLSISMMTEGGYMAENSTYNIDYDDDSTEIIGVPNNKPTTQTVQIPHKNRTSTEDYTDIQQFLNTTEKIWVYQSTQRTNDTCKVDDIDYAYELGACMTRYHVSNGSKYKTTVEAKFSFHIHTEDHSRPYNEFIIPNEEVHKPYETLVYQSKDNKCGVFYMNFHRVLEDPEVWFEMRLKNTSLLTGPDRGCMERFQEISRNQNLTYNYTSQCQCIFLDQAH